MNSTIPHSFSITTGQASFPGQIPVDPNKYSVKDDQGSVLLTAINLAGPGQLVVRDVMQTEVFRTNLEPGAQAVSLLAPNGAHLGNVLISAKPVKDKEHKKEKVKESKEAKRQVVLQNPANGAIMYALSGKLKHGGSAIEMKIKSFLTSAHTSLNFDKKHKEKDKAKNKKLQMGEVSGNLFTGTHVKLSPHGIGLSPADKYNIIGLVIGYMEIERHNRGQGTSGATAYQQHAQHHIPGSQVQIHQPHVPFTHPQAQPFVMGNPSHVSPQPQSQMGFSNTSSVIPGFVQPGSENQPSSYQYHQQQQH